VITQHDLRVLYIAGPGHGGPAMVANAYLEQTYSEVYPNVSQDADGMKRLFTQFSFPGGIPSHVAAETPGSIHEGGELGYALPHAFGAAFDNPDLLVACVVGDGEAETGALATSWHSNKFLNPVRDGAVLPILHLNEYKIAGPTVLARIPREELEALFRGYGYEPFLVEGDDPVDMHLRMAAALDTAVGRIRAIQRDARANGFRERPRWPMIVLASPKGWTGPKMVDGKTTEGTFRFASGADGRHESAGPREDPREMAEELPPAGTVRSNRPARSRARGALSDRRASHERQSARQRRPAAA
jgi:xylulose-5-phosphate/fructose-6-phosphate phosphoketolase